MLVLILGIGCVSATDINDSYTVENSDSTLNISNNKCYATNFKELNDFIKTHDVVELENDITRQNGEKDIVFDKDVTIDGKGHTINAKQKGRIFRSDSFSTLTLNNLKLINGVSHDDSGGAIDHKGNLICTNCSFINNHAKIYGGAINLNKGRVTCYNTIFINNGCEHYGGAVCCGSAIIFNSTFNKNNASSYSGGAISAKYFVECTDSIFTKNYAYIDGGAIYSDKDKVTVTSCLFDSNVVRGYAGQCYGGAICADEDVTSTDCKFINNMADDYGGAIYSHDNVKVTNCYFENNEVKGNNGGAIFSDDNVECKNSVFINNRALEHGGAICSDDNVECRNSVFINNQAKEWGGAIYCDDKANIYDSIFENNRVNDKQGGAVFCGLSDVISNCTFNNNHANEKGGAITIWNKCTTIVEDSKFTNNVATEGGAIYTDSRHHYITIHHNIFINNHNMDVYVTGYFKQIDHNYFGTPNPNFYADPGIFVEWKAKGPNLKYVDTTYFKTLEEYNKYEGHIDPDPGKHKNDSDASNNDLNTINKCIRMEPTGSPLIVLLLAIFVLPIVRFKN